MNNWKLENALQSRVLLCRRNWKLPASAKKLIVHPLFSGSAVMIMGSNVANFLAYIYHLLFGRILGPADYSELAAIISIIGILSVITASLNLVIVRFVSASELREQKGFLSWLKRISLIFSLAIVLAYSIFVPYLSEFTKIKVTTLFLIGPIFLFGTLSFINKSFLQGVLRFTKFVITANFEAVMKLFLGLLFVFLGYSVFGAIFGMLLASFLGWLLSAKFISDFNVRNPGKFKKVRQMLTYSVPIIFQTLSITSIYSTDVVLVKHFFNAHEAGLYASLSTLGRVIFFGAAPVASVMFPLISKRHAKGQGYKRIFIYSLLLTLVIASGVLFIYLTVPQLAIRILFGSAYLEVASLLVWFGVFMALFTLSSLFISYFLSRGKTGVVVLPVLAALMQVAGIWFWHDSIQTVIKVSLLSTSFLILALLIYFGHESIKAKEKP